ncbi:hypothetical protein GCM10023078_15540 [Gibbsiella greigii]
MPKHQLRAYIQNNGNLRKRDHDTWANQPRPTPPNPAKSGATLDVKKEPAKAGFFMPVGNCGHDFRSR